MNNSNQTNQSGSNEGPPSPPNSYPSTHGDFLPLDYSSPQRNSNTNTQRNQPSVSSPAAAQAAQSNQQQRQQQRAAKAGIRDNRRNNYFQNTNRHYQQHIRSTNRMTGFGRYSSGLSNGFSVNYRNNPQQQNRNFAISQYAHSSMLDDPWKDLEDRHNAMKCETDDSKAQAESKNTTDPIPKASGSDYDSD